MIAGGDGRVLGVFLKQFPLHIIHDGGTQEDAHRTLAACQQVQLLLFGHGSASLSAGQDDGLSALGNGELAPQLGSSSKERRDARRDVVVHLVLVEERHLLLNGSKDTGVARVQAHNEFAPVIEFLHQGTLLFKIHAGRTAYDGARLGTQGEFTWHERTCIEDQVGPFQHLAPTHRHQVGVARPGAHNLDKTFLLAQMLMVDGQRNGEILALDFGDNQFAVIGAQDGRCLTHAGRAHVLLHRVARVRHLNSGELLGCEEIDFFVILLS